MFFHRSFFRKKRTKKNRTGTSAIRQAHDQQAQAPVSEPAEPTVSIQRKITELNQQRHGKG